jgi:Serpentine type 7TM GPCR chemoreceptor Str
VGEDAIYGTLLVAAYAAVIWLNMSIWRHMAMSFAMINTIDSHTREMQRQLNVVLLMQAVVPFVTEVLPGMAIAANLLLALPLRYECYLVTIFYSWMPVLNPLMALSLIRPYRTAVWDMFHRLLPSWWNGCGGKGESHRTLQMETFCTVAVVHKVTVVSPQQHGSCIA